MVTSREPLPKSGLLSLGREAPCWHTASAEKLESNIARSAAVLGQDNEREKMAKGTHKLSWKNYFMSYETAPTAQNSNKCN